MPLYDFHCESCDITEEIFLKTHKDMKSVKCATCGKKMKSLISQTSEPICFDYFCTSSMKRYTGPKQRERELRKKGNAIL